MGELDPFPDLLGLHGGGRGRHACRGGPSWVEGAGVGVGGLKATPPSLRPESFAMGKRWFQRAATRRVPRLQGTGDSPQTTCPSGGPQASLPAIMTQPVESSVARTPRRWNDPGGPPSQVFDPQELLDDATLSPHSARGQLSDKVRDRLLACVPQLIPSGLQSRPDTTIWKPWVEAGSCSSPGN